MESHATVAAQTSLYPGPQLEASEKASPVDLRLEVSLNEVSKCWGGGPVGAWKGGVEWVSEALCMLKTTCGFPSVSCKEKLCRSYDRLSCSDGPFGRPHPHPSWDFWWLLYLLSDLLIMLPLHLLSLLNMTFPLSSIVLPSFCFSPLAVSYTILLGLWISLLYGPLCRENSLMVMSTQVWIYIHLKHECKL